ncbi:MAG TPA: heavy metal translocating P-type ATPase [Spirochaetales bacterium]|nr:heavy metal translocating P-type ATPase [Spirochaetales bacterium]
MSTKLRRFFHDLSPRQRKEVVQLSIAFLLGAMGIFLWESFYEPSQFTLLTILGAVCLGTAYLLAGFSVLQGAFRNILQGQVFDELFLMSVASLGAFFIGAMEEAVGVMVLYKIGEFFQEQAARQSRRSIQKVLSLRPTTVRILRNGEWVLVNPDEVKPGDQVQVRPGERLAVDGEVVQGNGSFDTSALTGESLPRSAEPGTEALAGFIVKEGALTIRCTRPVSESATSRIISLVEQATRSKARAELFIRRFARWYTPAMVLIALAVAFIPPILIPGQELSSSIYRALVILVISCPCALVLSVPLTYFAGLGGAAKQGILIKGAAVLDSLAEAETVVFDKTGTLTDGNFTIKNLVPAGKFSPEELLEAATAASARSNHPLAQAIQTFWASTGKPNPPLEEGTYQEIPGHGSHAKVNGHEVFAGNDRILHLAGVPHPCEPPSNTVVHVAVAGSYAGKIELGDSIKQDAKQALEELRSLQVKRIVLLTGDGKGPAERTAASLGLTEVHHDLLPADKVEKLEGIVQDPKKKGTVLFVGDGINDAPVLARSDAGIAMGDGSDIAIESADVVLMTDDTRRVPQAIAQARRTRYIVLENIFFALGVKFLFLTLGVLGAATLWEAVIADVGVALLAVLNATRALRYKQPTYRPIVP